ncbi:MAG: hypothetical protein IJD49_04205 [Clostridia bacterium]|nr:hypothetical protein [Clostridia bacterium]
MVKIPKRKIPLSYAQCDQTVTVYRANFDGEFSCTKTVYDKKAFLDFKKVVSVNKTGSKEAHSFLLVIKGNADLKPKDKVLPGVGEDILTREEWAEFIPSNRAGLVVIETVDPKYYNGEICHVEASG